MERFKYKPQSQTIKDTKTGYTYHTNNKEIYKLLNKLNKEGKH